MAGIIGVKWMNYQTSFFWIIGVDLCLFKTQDRLNRMNVKCLDSCPCSLTCKLVHLGLCQSNT